MPAKKPMNGAAEEAMLAMSRDEAAARLAGQVEKGRELMSKAADVENQNDFEEIRSAWYTWGEFNERLLKTMFTTDEVRKAYHGVSIGFAGAIGSFQVEVKALYDDIGRDIRRLESIEAQLPLFRVVAGDPQPQGTMTAKSVTDGSVFIVHGHDEALKAQVARVLGDLSLDFTILGEKANLSRSIIEKLEEEGDPASYAVVLLTGDDDGRKHEDDPKKEHALQLRARQNVVLELGWFFAKLGRRKVAILYAAGVELPSDTHGVTYIPVDAEWRFKLARELKAVGFDVDMNKVV